MKRLDCAGSLLTVAAVAILTLATSAQSVFAESDDSKPAVEAIYLTKLSKNKETPARIDFALEIIGRKFGDAAQSVNVSFVKTKNVNPASALKITKVALADDKIVVEGYAPLGAEATGLALSLGGKPVEVPKGFELSLKPAPMAPNVKQFGIKHQMVKSASYPNLFSLMVTKGSGDGEFSNNPNRMRVQLLPAGATNVTIRESNPEQMIVDFLAPEKYEVQSVYVTVYDGGDPDNRNVIALAKPFKEKAPAADPNQPNIAETDILFLQRFRGAGRLKLRGESFGEYKRPPIVAEDYLRCFKEKFAREEKRGRPFDAWVRGCTTEKGRDEDMRKWQDEINARVKVTLAPRNPDMQVVKTELLYIDDKIIDVYFEFTLFDGYSVPFRLSRTDVTIRKEVKNEQSLEAPGVLGTLVSMEGKTFHTSTDVGPKRDNDLQYRYTVLDDLSAQYLFGRGVSSHFYVICLSMINNGPKKVAVPLAAIQAEIEWATTPQVTNREKEDSAKTQQSAQSSAKRTGHPVDHYLEGPPTLSPVPLPDVTSFFNTDNKKYGLRAKLFNAFDGLATLGASLIPYVGPSFKDAHIVFTGGFLPAARQVSGDLSGQQLQALASRSWQTIEQLAAKGGSIEKYVFIPRGEQVYYDVPDYTGSASGSNQRAQVTIRKKIKNLMGLEVTGYEIIESEPKKASETEHLAQTKEPPAEPKQQ